MEPRSKVRVWLAASVVALFALLLVHSRAVWLPKVSSWTGGGIC